MRFRAYAFYLSLETDGVMVAQLVLVQSVGVQIPVGLPLKHSLRISMLRIEGCEPLRHCAACCKDLSLGLWACCVAASDSQIPETLRQLSQTESGRVCFIEVS